MPFKVEHTYRFDAQDKLDADDWLLIPRAQLRPDFALDDALAQSLAQMYFEIVSHESMIPIKVAQEGSTIRLRIPSGKTALLFAEPERLVDAQRAETSWRIAGGFLLAHNVNYGGRFYLGAEWQNDALKVYSTIRRYPPRLVTYWRGSNGIALYNMTQAKTHRQIQEKFLQQAAARILENINP